MKTRLALIGGLAAVAALAWQQTDFAPAVAGNMRNSEADALLTNVRFRWEYQPGSELFVVYNEERDTLSRRFPALSGRSFIVKINRLFRF